MELVELYVADTYQGLHTFNTAKELAWKDRGFCYLDRSVKRDQFMAEVDITKINSWMKHGKLIPVTIGASQSI